MIKRITIVFLLFQNTLIYSQLSKKDVNKTYNVTLQEQCEKKQGKWHKNKCWKHYKNLNQSIPQSDIDNYIKIENDKISETHLIIDDQDYEITNMFPQKEGDFVSFVISFVKNNQTKSLLFAVEYKKISNNEPQETQAVVLNGNLLEEMDKKGFGQEKIMELAEIGGTVSVVINNVEDIDFSLKGNIKTLKDGTIKSFSLRINNSAINAGTTKITIEDNTAVLTGETGVKTLLQLQEHIQEYPEIKTLVLKDVQGTLNASVNSHIARYIREKGFTTKLLKDSKIASGGVTLFCAGVKRIYTKGAEIGVHSWGNLEFTARDFNKDHPIHDDGVNDYNFLLGDVNGEEFYFYSIKASAFDDMHWMSEKEVKKYMLATEYIK